MSFPATGRLVWTAGQVPVAADGTVAPTGDWEAWNDVVKLTFFVVDIAGLPTIRAIRDEFVDVERPPTNSLVQVAGLFLPEVLL